MTATQIRKQLREYLSLVDDEYLSVLKTIIEDRLKVKEVHDGFFTKEEEKELERREQEYLSGKMSSDSLEAVNKRVLRHIREKK
ncbi:MAG: hypothetical protein ACK5Z2_10705 [Bacteroidota bacterium]|jgi:hypothetical protein